MAAVAVRTRYGKPQHLQHAGITFVEVECDDLRIAVDAEC